MAEGVVMEGVAKRLENGWGVDVGWRSGSVGVGVEESWSKEGAIML